MSTTTPEALIKQLSWRYATKKFDPSRKVPEHLWKTLEHAMMLAPSSYGLQPWRFVVVTDPRVRARLREAGFNQPQITDASHLVVFTQKIAVTPADVDAYIDRIAEVRNVPREALQDFRGMMVGSMSNPPGLPGGSMEIWTRSQVYIALGFLLASAAQLGVDACPMEGFDPARFDEILGLKKDGYHAAVLATVGYRAADDGFGAMAKVRARADDVIKHV